MSSSARLSTSTLGLAVGSRYVRRRGQAGREVSGQDELSEFPWRDRRAGVGWRTLSAVSLLIMVAVVCLGAWWTATAAHSGDTAGTLLRFSLASVFGAYYLMLYRTARLRQR